MSSIADDEITPILPKNKQKPKEPVSYQTISNANEVKLRGGNSSKKKEKEDTKTATFKELFRYATCADRLLMILGALVALGQGSGWPLLSIVFGQMTNDFLGNQNFSSGNITGNMTTPVLPDFEATMTQYALYYFYIGAGVFACAYLQVSCWVTACERQTHKMRLAYFRAILRQEIGWFDKHQSGELTTRLADDLERIREGIGDKFSICLQFISTFVAGFTIGFIKSWRLTLVMMSLTPILAICAAFLSRLIATFSKREQVKYAAAGSIAEEVISCIRTVTSFNGQKQEIERYAEALAKSRDLGIKKATITAFGVGVTFLTLFCAYGLAFWYGSTLVEEHRLSGGLTGLTPGEVFTVFFSVMMGSFSLGNAGPKVAAIFTAKGAASEIFKTIDREPKIDASSKKGKTLPNIVGNIDFTDVNFTYPTREDVPVLKNMNLSVKPGQTVALVGSSGCGKSTVVNLLLRFYDSNSGKISLDGHDLKDLRLGWLRDNIGLVSQEPILFDCTIEENIALGKDFATKDEIVEAAKIANAHSFITSLPKGYDTMVGEHGAQLSGGQKQRVAIARALIRDPKLLLLDEATSALDASSEGIVQKALDKAREGRTTIVIAHRLSTIQTADVIYVIDDGCIVESGHHAELMAKEGAYHQLVTLQTFTDIGDDDDAEEEEGKKSKSDPKYQKQISSKRQTSMKEDMSEEEEEVAKPGWCRLMQENSPEWPFIVFGCIAASINGATMPLFAVFFSEIIRVFDERKTLEEMREGAVFWSLMFVMLGGINFFGHLIQTSSFGRSGERLTYRLRLNVFKNILRQNIGWFDQPRNNTGALTTRLATDSSMVKNGTGIRLAVVIQSAVGLAAGLGIAFYFGWKLALVILAGVPIMALAGALNMKVMMGNQRRDTDQLEAAGQIASEAIENIRTVQAIRKEERFYDKYFDFLRKPHRANLVNAHVYGLAFAFSQGIVFMLYGAAFRYGAYLVVHEPLEYSPDRVYRVFFAIAFTGMAIGQASSFLPDYTKARTAAAMIFKLLDTEPLIDIFSGRGIQMTDINGDIQFNDIHFSYPMRMDFPVLSGFNLHIHPGQTIALVGPSGCGKSTVVSLLQRFYDPQTGVVSIDGVKVSDMHLDKLRSFISVVSQEPVLFDCSICDNILYGLKTQGTMDDVIKATKVANIHEFITSLPEGYDTPVGEKGTQLSGGQKQRVAIARALVRNPRILLLDEATSALDTESEKLVQTALDNAQEGRTCIVIAHRLSTIQNADLICVMDQGMIVESGTHQELLNRKEVYASLVSGQQFSKS